MKIFEYGFRFQILDQYWGEASLFYNRSVSKLHTPFTTLSWVGSGISSGVGGQLSPKVLDMDWAKKPWSSAQNGLRKAELYT